MLEEELFQELIACTTTDEIHHFIDSRHASRELPFLQFLQTARSSQSFRKLPIQQRFALQTLLGIFFDIVADAELVTGDVPMPEGDGEVPSPVRIDAAIGAVIATADADLATAPSRADVARVVSRTLWNLGALDALTRSPTDAQREAGLSAYELWHDVIHGLMTNGDDERGWEELEHRFRVAELETIADLIARWSDRWHIARDLPRHAMSIATLHSWRCGSCDLPFWSDFWNYISWRDRDRAAAIAATLDDVSCPVCCAIAAPRRPTLTFVQELEHLFTSRMRFFETHYGLVIRAPAGVRRSDRMNVLLTAMLHRIWPLRTTEEEDETAFVINLAYSDAQFLDYVKGAYVPREEEDSDRWTYFYNGLLGPLAREIRNGKISLEEAVTRVLRIAKEHPVLMSRGWYGEDSIEGDADRVIQLALFGILNESAGYYDAAAFTWANGAAEAVMAGRLGEAVWMKRNAQRLAADHELTQERRAQIDLRSAAVAVALAEAARDHRAAAEAQELVVRIHRERATRTRSASAALLLAGELLRYASLVFELDFAASASAVDEAFAICFDIEAREDHDVEQESAAQAIRHLRGSAERARGLLLTEMDTYVTALMRDDDDFLTRYLTFRSVKREEFRQNVATLAATFEGRIRVHDSMVGIDYTLPDDIRALRREAFERALALAEESRHEMGILVAAANLARVAARDEDLLAVERYVAMCREHIANCGGIGTAQMLSFTANTLSEAGLRAEAAELWKSAYLAWATARRNMGLDELRRSLAINIFAVTDGITRVLNTRDSAECFSVLETLKCGSLHDALATKPLRIADLEERPDVLAIRESERRIAACFSKLQRLEGGVPFDDDPAVVRSELAALENEYSDRKSRLLLEHPRYSMLLADLAPAFRPADQLLAPYLAAADAAVGFWAEYEHVIVYGRAADGREIAMRIPVIERMREECGRTWKSLHQFVHEYRAALETIASEAAEERFRATYAAPLHRMLMQPVLDALGPCREIVISGQDCLHQLPWSTLFDGSAYLVEHVAIRQVLSFALELASPPVEHTKVVIVVDPDAGADVSPLPAARREGNDIARIARSQDRETIVLAGRDATWDALTENAPGAAILHLACHATFDPSDAWHSSLVLSTPGEAPAADYVTLERIAEGLALDGALVVVAACDSGLMRIQIGDELVGLLRALYYAGARRVLGSLWQISDRATAVLMPRFYEYLLAERLSPARALRAAQLDMLTHRDRAFRFSSAWGAFALFDHGAP